MGKVYLNGNNKLVVETDNGVINPDGTSKANILDDEKYYIEARDLCRLINAINKCDIKIYSGSFMNHFIGGLSYYRILTDKETSEQFNELIKMKDNEIKSIKDKIKQYNSDRKIFWRPIDIED